MKVLVPQSCPTLCDPMEGGRRQRGEQNADFPPGRPEIERSWPWAGPLASLNLIF